MQFSILQAYAVALPAFVDEYRITTQFALLGFTLFVVGVASSFWLGGILTARLGVLKTIFLAQALLIIPQLLIPLSPSFEVILMLRTVQGLSLLSLIALLTCLYQWFPISERSTAFGFHLGSYSLGVAAGGYIAGWLMPLGWRTAYMYIAIFTIIATAIFAIALSRKPKPNPNSNSSLPEQPKSSNNGSRVVYRTKLTYIFSSMILLYAWGSYSNAGGLPVHLYTLNYLPLEVGTISLVVGLAGFVGASSGGLLAAYLYKRTGRLKTSYIKIVMLGAIISVTGWSSISFVAPYSFGATIAITFLMGFGAYASLPNIYALIATDYKPEHVSLAIGFSTFIAAIPEAVGLLSWSL